MIRRFAVLLATLLALVAAGIVTAQAATVFSYSKDTGAYGWCAGYATAKGESCANDACVQYNGTNCATVLECNGGWGSAAFAENGLSGFGATCDWRDPASARTWALAACMIASNTLCWTSQTFDQSGNIRSDQDSKSFDLVLLTQAMLNNDGYAVGTADGVMGPKTRAAIEKFQAALGLPQTGEPDESLIPRLRDAIGGVQALIDQMKAKGAFGDKLDAYTWSYSASPVPQRSFGETLMLRTEADKRMALAAMLDVADTPCTLPAKNVAVVYATKFATWDVQCDQGDYQLKLTGEGSWEVYDQSPAGAGQSTSTSPGKAIDPSDMSDSPAGHD